MPSMVEGVVMEVDGAVAKVRVSRHDDCSACGACPGDSAILMEANSRFDVKLGQRVLVEIGGEKIVGSAFIVFLLPLFSLGAGCGLGFLFSRWASVSESMAMVMGGAFFLLASFFYIRRFDKSVAQSRNLPTIVELIQ